MVTKLVMTPETQAALAQTGVAALQALLNSVHQSEPEVWKLLNAEIESGVKSRGESDSDPD